MRRRGSAGHVVPGGPTAVFRAVCVAALAPKSCLGVSADRSLDNASVGTAANDGLTAELTEDGEEEDSKEENYEFAVIKDLVVKEVVMELPFKPLGSASVISAFVAGAGIAGDCPGVAAGGLTSAVVFTVCYSWILHATGMWLEACGLYAAMAAGAVICCYVNRRMKGNAPPVNRAFLERGSYEWVRSEAFDLMERPHTSPAAFVIACAMLFVVVWSCVMLSMESMAAYNPKVNPEWVEFFDFNEMLVTLIFTFEYLVRLWSAPETWRFAKRFMNVMDAASVLPFWLGPLTGLTVSLQMLRIIRILKVFRLLKLARFSDTLRVIVNALKRSGDGLIFLGVFMAIGVFLISSLLWMVEAKAYDFEDECWKLEEGGKVAADCLQYQSVPDSIYYAVTTMTTVGYGDVVPASDRTRIVASVGMVMGVLVLAMPVGILATEFQATYDEVKKSGRLRDAEAIGPAAFQVVRDLYSLSNEAAEACSAAQVLIIRDVQEKDPKYSDILAYVMDGFDADITQNLEQVLELLHRIIPTPTEEEEAAGQPTQEIEMQMLQP